MNDFEKYLTDGKDHNWDKKQMLDEIKILKRRLNEAEAIVKSGGSPFKHLSLIKSNIIDIQREMFGVYK